MERAVRLARILDELVADLPAPAERGLHSDAWFDDIVACLIEGGTVEFHVSSLVGSRLSAGLRAVAARLDPTGHRIRVTVPDPAVPPATAPLMFERLNRPTSGSIAAANGWWLLRPTGWLLQTLGAIPDTRRHELTGTGIRLADETGALSRAARQAAEFLATASHADVHVHLVDPGTDGDHHRVYAILRAAGRIRRDRYHVIGCAAETGSATLLARLVAHLRDEVAGYLDGRNRRRVDFSGMRPEQYLHYQYGSNVEARTASGILAVDEQLIRALIAALPAVLRQPVSGQIAVPGWGPFSYLGLLLAGYLSDTGTIDVTDVAPANVAYLRRWQAGGLAAEDAAVLAKFERFIVAEGGPRYEGCVDRTRRAARIGLGDINALRPGTYDAVGESFVSCSFTSSRQLFHHAVRAKRRALVGTGNRALIALHMLGGRGWQGYPLVYLTVPDVLRAYADAGLETEVHPVLAGAGEKYAGMAAVVARSLPGESGISS
jgi:hypothetical protein